MDGKYRVVLGVRYVGRDGKVNDYSMGALEALSWARTVLRKCKTLREFQGAEEEINEMMIRLASGEVISFRDKAEFIREF